MYIPPPAAYTNTTHITKRSVDNRYNSTYIRGLSMINANILLYRIAMGCIQLSLGMLIKLVIYIIRLQFSKILNRILKKINR